MKETLKTDLVACKTMFLHKKTLKLKAITIVPALIPNTTILHTSDKRKNLISKKIKWVATQKLQIIMIVINCN